MDRIQSDLNSISELIRTYRSAEAESRFRELLSSVTPNEFEAHQADFSEAVQEFLPKRRRQLRALLDEWLEVNSAERRATIHQGTIQRPDFSEAKLNHQFLVTEDEIKLDEIEIILRSGFAELSERHIFQWSTFYRDFLSPLFLELIAIAAQPRLANELVRIVNREVATHSREIFEKGYEYVSVRPGSHGVAVTKSLGGLQRFLELPIELYSATLTSNTVGSLAYALRRVTSALVCGILEGYGSVLFGEDDGWQILPRFPRSWAHYLGFLTHEDLSAIEKEIEPGAFRDGIVDSVLPTIRAIDNLVAQVDPEFSGLPSLGQFIWEQRRLDIALLPPLRAADAKSLDIQCFMDRSFLSTRTLEEAVNRGVVLVTGPLRADVREWVESHNILRGMTVDTSRLDENVFDNASDQAFKLLSFAIAREVDGGTDSALLSYNFARGFPLHNPFMARYFHVYRGSVRNLLRAFERRNGVRLWCSVRRSGKTTACFDLSTTTGTSTVVTQTCDSTDQRFEANIFYDHIIGALASGKQLPNDFFMSIVHQCSPNRRESDYRYVFVLDEYETLFERLRITAKRDKEVRYTVVQPLLNQMVAFSRENLLVFIGQRPDAHYILMDQNQLSAYVEQDTFPLFTHGSDGDSEMNELLKKVLTQRIPFSPSFSDCLYRETAGHPFLTVKLLVEFFDWLILQRRPARGIRLTDHDFTGFQNDKLTSSAVAISQQYDFFRAAISEALSLDGRSETPWLHAIYSCLRQIVELSPDAIRCTRAEFVSIVHSVDYDGKLGYSSDYLLSTGSQANFFQYSDSEVWPRIPLLARIAQATRPRLAN